jgi:hypothetical protein
MLDLLESKKGMVMAKVIDYIVLTRGSIYLLPEEVLLWVARGYTPIGGVAYSTSGCYQAMVKYEEKTK